MEFTTDRGLFIAVLESLKNKELEKLSHEFEAVLFSREDEICDTCTDCKGVVCEVEDCQKIKVERNEDNHFIWDMKEVIDEILQRRYEKDELAKVKKLNRKEKKETERIKNELFLKACMTGLIMSSKDGIYCDTDSVRLVVEEKQDEEKNA